MINRPDTAQNHAHSPFRRVFWGFVLFFITALPILTFFAPRSMGSVLPIAGILLGGIAVFRFSKTDTDTTPAFPLKHMGLYFIAVLALCTLSSLWSLDAEYALKRCSKVALLFLGGTGFLALAQRFPRDLVPILGKLLLGSIAIISALVVTEYISYHFLYKFFRGIEMETPIPHSVSNKGCALILLLLWPITLFLKSLPQTKRAYYALPFIVVIPIAAYFGRQDSALLGILLSLPVFIIFLSPYKKIALYAVLILGGIITLGAPWIFPLLYTHLAPQIPDIAHITAAGRLEIWGVVANRAQENLIYGHGIEAARHIKDFAFSNIYFTKDSILHPHNSIVQIWFEFGIIGILLFIAGMGYLIFYLWRNLKRVPLAAALALLTILTVISAVGYGVWQSWWLGMIFYTCAIFHIFAKNLE